jgi:hypothetical protein
MRLTYSAAIFTALWVLMVGGLGIGGQWRSLLGWTFLACLAAVPMFFTLLWTNGRAESLSQIIQQARQ